ncbi:MAG: T9SS type A sorting domain-containing protein, partial [Chitinophagaceae bacterium]|nr:T9SS type A sorting domain-containing protein [Chitinophagaceae bacterium]
KMIPCTPSTGDTIKTGFCASYTLNGITYTKAGIYTQMLSNSEGCDSVVTLQLTSAPIIDMTVIKTADTLKAATAGKTYQWVECPSMDFVPGATGQSFAPAKSGSYAVIVYVHPCRYTSACTNVTRLGIDEAETSIKAVVYPSPAKDIVTVSTKENLKQASLSIMNLHGQLVLSEENVSGNRIELDLSGQASGVYFLKIVSEGRASEVMKIIKE